VKGNPEVIQILNTVLAGELVAINQYFLHSRMCKDWGFEKLADLVWKESIDEMKHAQTLTDRILFLEGIPNLQKLGKLSIGENIEEILKCDLALEFANIPNVQEGIELCYKHTDHASRELLEHILVQEEEHVDWLEAQLHIIKSVGVENYLTTQL